MKGEIKMTEKSKQILENLDRAVLDQVPAIVLAVDRDFNLVLLNATGCKWFGKTWEDIEGTKCYDNFNTPVCNTPDCPIRQTIDTGEIILGQTEKRVGDEKAIIEFAASPLKNARGDIVGGVEYVVDVTEKVEAEAKTRQLQQDILELSTPVLSLWGNILAIPLIGTLDSRRTQDVMEKSLTRMAQEKSRVLIVDITGVPVVDTMVANHLIRLSEAVRLMGGESILTGISPTTARTIVHLGIDLSKLNTRATLAQGLELAMEIVKKGRKES
jgi:rsbT co-antagonist protein RsbR